MESMKILVWYVLTEQLVDVHSRIRIFMSVQSSVEKAEKTRQRKKENNCRKRILHTEGCKVEIEKKKGIKQNERVSKFDREYSI